MIYISANGIKKQEFTVENDNKFIKTNISYLDEKVETNSILNDGNENISITMDTKKFNKFSKVSFSGKYDLRLDFRF